MELWPALIEQSNRAFDRRGTEMHVPLRRRQILMPGQFLNRPSGAAAHRQVRAERVSQNVHTNIANVRATCRPLNQPLHETLRQRFAGPSRAVQRAVD